MDFQSAKDLLNKYEQSHLLQYYEELSIDDKSYLLSQIEGLDFSVAQGLNGKREEQNDGEYSPINAVSLNDIKELRQRYFSLGIDQIKSGKVAAVLLAGGQGTRLGYDAPKGTFNIGINKNLSIFGQQFANMHKVVQAAGCYFTVFVMTSDKNNEQTKQFFKQNNYFGFPKDKILFFVQKTSPALDLNGKILLEEKNKIALAPNGNGGWYSSLIESEAGKAISEQNIEWLNVYSVDNVLQQICDPIFIGATLSGGYNCGAKVVKKTCPEERVGVLMNQNGKPTIVEYYEISSELASKRDADGELTYRYGVILNYLFKVDVLNEVVSKNLPWHYAKKILPHLKDGEKVYPTEPNGYKTETLVVDMIKLMGNCLAVEVDREKEFAPVKNKTGVDSVDSARALLIKNGIEI
ncbi:MAG: UDPGP type 1 family protein [Clostridiales bacterium]|nr:UDPGP type 1 family protein [Clostridiales bacterium]